jgi:hypothetical protein
VKASFVNLALPEHMPKKLAGPSAKDVHLDTTEAKTKATLPQTVSSALRASSLTMQKVRQNAKTALLANI